ncbi:hypothetical protein Sjap_011454 [Stephania japonica]|uniref:Uncharacterized protein n=1 Tax=Stephania japonica TaxID=461633 RepID=A0AAP0JDJ3_9MAGN
MTDQTRPCDDSGATGSRFASVKELHTLPERVVSQDQQLEKILRILRTSVTVAPSAPSTSTLSATQETDTPIITATFAATTTIAAIQEVLDVPLVQTEIVPATSGEKGIKATAKDRQLREFKWHNPTELYGGMNLVAAERICAQLPNTYSNEPSE